MSILLIDAEGFTYEKEGKSFKYYQMVISTDKGYQIKKISADLYSKIREIDGLPYFVEKLLYDEYGRVVEIIK